MADNLHILILRDPKESPAKCSLTPLRGVTGIRFERYDPDERIDADGRILLDPAGEPLTLEDAGRDLLLIDCSWRRVGKLLKAVDGELIPRRLPPLTTAYPRKSKTFEDPDGGLASIEALFVATAILGQPRRELLDEYRWRSDFLERNGAVLRTFG